METTYTFQEIKSFIRTLDDSGLEILEQLVQEERELYVCYEYRAILRLIKVLNAQSLDNGIKTEYLLSFN